MARGEFVDNSIWDEMDGFTLEATALYIWSFTNPKCNMAGLYVVSERAMLESKVPARKLPAALEELRVGEKLFYVQPLVWVKARVKRLHSKHPNIARAVAKDVAKVAVDHPLRVAFLVRYAQMHWLRDCLSDLALESQNQETLGRPSKTLPRVSDADAYAVAVKEVGGSGGKETPADALPSDLLPALKAVVPKVKSALERIAAAKGAMPPTLAGVGRVLADYPDRAHVEAAGDLEQWLLHGTGQTRPVKDVVGYYRNQLKRAPRVMAPLVQNGEQTSAQRRAAALREVVEGTA